MQAPAKSLLEPLRRLHTTLQLGDMLERDRGHTPRLLVFLSADAGDGRSSVIANLARVQCEAGERVAVVEADFRRPTQAALLDAGGTYGLADVLAGKISLGEAMQVVQSTDSVDVGGDAAAAPAAVSTVVGSRSIGSLSVLVSGGPVSNPPALLARPEMAELLGSLADEFDHVLIDAPPPLEVSDVMPLLQLADGIVIVARVGHTREVSAQRLAQLLGRTASAPLLGAVANCVPRKDIERYGFSSAQPGPRARRLVGR
jgi:Mrp family chromosome partitioning ATPase